MFGSAFQVVRQILNVDLCFRCGTPVVGRCYGLCTLCAADLPTIEAPFCEGCGRSLISEGSVCLRCRDVQYGFDSARGCFQYRDRGAEIIRFYKMGNHPRLAGFLAQQLLPIVTGVVADWGTDPPVAIVPVPPRPARLRTYGWDPVGRLASRLSQLTGLPVAPVLRRSRGVSQKSLNLAGRLTNLAGKIHVRPGPVPATCVLLDDVMTTGATLSICATALKERGVSQVRCLVAAID